MKITKSKKSTFGNYERYGFRMPEHNVYKSGLGLSVEVVKTITELKKEPEWMAEKRLKALDIFNQKPMPSWGGDLSKIDFNAIHYYVKANSKVENDWKDVPVEIKETYDRLGIPEAEKQYLGGVKAQYESEVVYGSLQKQWREKGVIFLGMDQAVKEYPEIVKHYFGTLIPAGDNKFAALNTAVWSGGSFIYVPKGVKIDMPLQAYFRINSVNMGQFERTLIIVDEGAFVHYVEGCFLAGAMVKTNVGEKTIETIKEGDFVWTHKGRYRPVYATQKRQYQGKIFSIAYYGDNSQKLEVTEEHPLLVARRKRDRDRNKSFELEWVDAGHLNKKDYLVMPIRKIDPVTTGPYFCGQIDVSGIAKKIEITQDKDLFRLFGYFLAEGHVDKEHYLTFSFNANEHVYLDDVAAIVKRIMGKEVIKNKVRNGGQTLVVCSTLWARFFNQQFGGKIGNKKIPDWIWQCDREVLGEMIKGMWRGDGSYDKKKNYFRFSSINRQIADGFRDILLNLGILVGINIEKRELPRKNIYQVIVYSPYNEMFGSVVEKKATNGRKTGSPVTMNSDFVYYPVRSIETREVNDLVYNFSVTEDESYLAQGVISHNCTAPIYSTDSLHSAVVEIFVKKGARCRYTTIQNWSKNVYNLVTKRARVEEEGTMEWIDGNLGSKLTMKYPSVFLVGRKAHGEILSMAVAGEGQHQDAGGKCVHLASETSSRIISKSISMDGGRASYRGMVRINPGAKNCRSKVVCDALILDQKSRSDTYPTNIVSEASSTIEHEATVSKIGEEQLFYLMSRGFSQSEAEGMVVNGFVEPIARELPMEYSIELNRLIQMQMEGSVG